MQEDHLISGYGTSPHARFPTRPSPLPSSQRPFTSRLINWVPSIFGRCFSICSTNGSLPGERSRVPGLLVRAASETLLEIASDPQHLGARIGMLAVLHTWSQRLGHHPHLHCLVPPVDWRSIAPAGSRQDVTSFSRLACSAACSAASCSPSSSRAVDRTSYAMFTAQRRSSAFLPYLPTPEACAPFR
jgi:hypothetical protein